MEEQIRVYVVKYPGRTNLVMRYLDPLSNKQVARSTGTSKQREAERVAAKWEAELREGRYQKRNRMTWEEFRERFEANGMHDMRGTTAANYFSTFNAFEELTNPKKHLADITTERVATFTRELRKPYTITRGTGKKQTSRKAKRSMATVARHLRHLKAAARWGALARVAAEAPAIRDAEEVERGTTDEGPTHHRGRIRSDARDNSGDRGGCGCRVVAAAAAGHLDFRPANL